MQKKIKKLTVIRYDLPGPDAGIVDGGNEGRLISETEYEQNHGKVICEKQYGHGGALDQQTEFEYSEDGFLTREVIKEASGEVMNDRSWEHDSQGRIIREYHHYADGSKDSVDYSYDDKGQLVMKTLADEDGEVEQCDIFEYDDKGRLARERVYQEDAGEVALGRDGKPEIEKTYKYNNGLLGETTEKDEATGSFSRRVNEFDKEGRRTGVTVFDENDRAVERIIFTPDSEGRPLEITEETRTKRNTIKMKYTSDGNVGFQEEYDMHGNLLNRIERSYDGDGRLEESRALVNIPARGVVNMYYIVRHRYEFFE